MIYRVNPGLRWVKLTSTGWVVYNPDQHNLMVISPEKSELVLRLATELTELRDVDNGVLQECLEARLISIRG